MPDTTITLDVQPAATAPGTYTPCQGNSAYKYQYSGGNIPGKPGSFKFTHAGGNKQIQISLQNSAISAGFAITNIGFVYDNYSDPKDLTVSAPSTGSNTWTVTDSDVDQEEGYFVVITKTGSVTGITCDPRWQNN